jgi:hypothetical protein
MPIDDQAAKRSGSPKQSAELLDLQKNVLLNGFDSSTENMAFFNAIFQKN